MIRPKEVAEIVKKIAESPGMGKETETSLYIMQVQESSKMQFRMFEVQQLE
jgi:hypothetical protein